MVVSDVGGPEKQLVENVKAKVLRQEGYGEQTNAQFVWGQEK